MGLEGRFISSRSKLTLRHEKQIKTQTKTFEQFLTHFYTDFHVSHVLKQMGWERTRPIAISRVLRVISFRPTDRPTDRQSGL